MIPVRMTKNMEKKAEIVKNILVIEAALTSDSGRGRKNCRNKVLSQKKII
jgi:hypothetical protein